MSKPKGLFILSEYSFSVIYGPDQQAAINEMVDIYAPPQTSESVKNNPDLLSDLEFIFSGWGGPCIDEDFLAAAPNLKAVFYGAGSIKGIQSPALWQKNIPISSAWGANAIPVAEFTLGQILLSLKRTWQHVLSGRNKQAWPETLAVPGAYHSKVGIISLGMIGRMVCKYLQNFDIDVFGYDPFIAPEEARSLGVELLSLEEIFTQCDVVSLHTPWLPETENMITAAHFGSMKEGATFINTARGAVVDEEGMVSVLQKRPDIHALLDVTYPEPPKEGSPLYELANVLLTPHIAGSMGCECNRMGQYMVAECRRFLDNESLEWQVTEEMFKRMA